MNIEYLEVLRNNPLWRGVSKPIQPISLSDIAVLEGLYNNGTPFPKALKELQQNARNWLSKYNRSIQRPFFVLDVYNAPEQFLFVYLDEGVEDPFMYGAYLPDSQEDTSWVYSLEHRLSNYINDGIKMVKQGYNPF